MSLLGKEWYGEFIAHKDGFKEGVEEGFKVGYETAKKEFGERKKGKWIRRHYVCDYEIPDTFICSECRYECCYDAETGVSADYYNYCPNCGAIMGVDNGEL